MLLLHQGGLIHNLRMATEGIVLSGDVAQLFFGEVGVGIRCIDQVLDTICHSLRPILRLLRQVTRGGRDVAFRNAFLWPAVLEGRALIEVPLEAAALILGQTADRPAAVAAAVVGRLIARSDPV